MFEEDFAIRLKNVTKLFPAGTSRQSLFRIVMSNLSRKWAPETFAALHAIDLEVRPGDRIALIGNNGSGKSTLLRIAAGLHAPTSGTVETRGERTLLAGLGVGMVDELTVENNIYLYGAMHGISRQALRDRLEEILEWAGLLKFRHAALKSLSSGMRSRLAFSVTRCIATDIYLLDEALTAGDRGFRDKCDLVFQDYARSKRTMLIATHDFAFARRHCNRTLWLDDGQQVSFGPTERVLDLYQERQEERRQAV